MEVHHHAHTSRKKWTHYFWEFLMLFLAVFCGFLAEYQLEHMIEKDRAKQYINSMYDDLKADTTRLNILIRYDEEKISVLKTMTNCYDSVSKDLKATGCMGILIKQSSSNRSFHITDRTLRQLANAGGFRLLRKEDADSILAYESLFTQYQNFESTIFQESQDNVRNTLNQLADFKVLYPMRSGVAILNNIDTSDAVLKGPLLFSNDKVLMNKWFNELTMYLRVTNAQRNLLLVFRNKAIGLIEYYKQKHHLE
jgi:hypothetical protein